MYIICISLTSDTREGGRRGRKTSDGQTASGSACNNKKNAFRAGYCCDKTPLGPDTG